MPAGQRPHIEDLLRRRPWLVAVARETTRDDGRAEDAVHELLLSCTLSRPGPVDRVSGWLKRAVRNVGLDLLRDEQRRTAGERAAARPEAQEPPTAADDRFVARALLEELDRLDEADRTPIVMRFFEDLPPARIAERLGIRPGAARVRLHRALERLRARVVRRIGGEPSRGRRSWPLLGILGRWRRRIAFAALPAAALLALLLPAASERPAEPRPAAPREIAAAPAPRRARQPAPVAGLPAAVSDAEAPAHRPPAPHRITGRLDLLLEGRPLETDLVVTAAIERVGPDVAFELGTIDFPARTRPVVARVEARSGSEFSIAVDAPGRYWLTVEAPGVKGGLGRLAGTTQTWRNTVELLPRLEVTAENRAGELVWETPNGDVEPMETAPSGASFLPGPVFPATRIGIRPATGPHRWWRIVRDARRALHTPRTRPQTLVLVAAATEAPIAGAMVQATVQGLDGALWSTRLTTDAGGRATVPIFLDEHEHGRTALSIFAPGYERWALMRYGAYLATRDGGPRTLRLRAHERPSGVLLTEDGRPADGAVVIELRGRIPSGRGACGDDGRFRLDLIDGSPAAADDGATIDDVLAVGRSDLQLFAVTAGGAAGFLDTAGGPDAIVARLGTERRASCRLVTAHGTPLRNRPVLVSPCLDARPLRACLNARPLRALARRFHTDGAGRITLSTHGDGGWLIEARGDGSAQLSGVFDPRAGDGPLVLRGARDAAGGRFRLRLVGGDGRPLRRCGVQIEAPEVGAAQAIATDGDGTADVVAPPGASRVVCMLCEPDLGVSLTCAAALGFDRAEHTLRVFPLRHLACAPQRPWREGRPFAVVLFEPLAGGGTRRADTWRPGLETVVTTEEPQRITIVESGGRPASFEWHPGPDAMAEPLKGFTTEEGAWISGVVRSDLPLASSASIAIRARSLLLAGDATPLAPFLREFGGRAELDGDGAFECGPLTPGVYVLELLDPRLHGRWEVSLDGDADLVLEVGKRPRESR